MSKQLQIYVLISCLCGICYGVKCYSASSSTSKFPTAAKIEQQCSARSQGCQKQYEISFIKGVASPANFTWGCSEHEDLPFYAIKDGDTTETSRPMMREKYLITDGNTTESSALKMLNAATDWHYIRVCYCTGDQCNGKQLDEKCNDEPKWHHECYAGLVVVTENNSTENSTVKPTLSVVKATEAQLCTRFVGRFLHATFYSLTAESGPWLSQGCANQFNQSNGTFGIEKSTCCGDKCYGNDNVKFVARNGASVRQIINYAVVINALVNMLAR